MEFHIILRLQYHKSVDHISYPQIEVIQILQKFSPHEFPIHARLRYHRSVDHISYPQIEVIQIPQKFSPHQLSADWSDSNPPEVFTTWISHTYTTKIPHRYLLHQIFTTLRDKNIPKAYRTIWQFRIFNLKTQCSRFQKIRKMLLHVFQRNTSKNTSPCHRRGTNSTVEFLNMWACQQCTERFETLPWRHQQPANPLLSDSGAAFHRGYANTGSCKRPGRSARTPHHSHYIIIIIIIIIIIFIYCKWVVTRWQWLLNTYFLTLIINLLRDGHMRSM
jgi:hypothetical protein